MTRIINNVSRKEIRLALRKKQTKEESLLWQEIRNNKLGFKFRRQVSIGSYIADFYCREKFLVIELDGAPHADSKDYDSDRNMYFEALGIRTLRFWNGEVTRDLKGVLGKIIQMLDTTSLSPEASDISPGKGRVGGPGLLT